MASLPCHIAARIEGCGVGDLWICGPLWREGLQADFGAPVPLAVTHRYLEFLLEGRRTLRILNGVTTLHGQRDGGATYLVCPMNVSCSSLPAAMLHM